MAGLATHVPLILVAFVVADGGDYAADAYDVEDTYGSAFLGGDGSMNDFGYATDGLGYEGYSLDDGYYHDEYDLYYNQYGVYASEYDLDYFEEGGAADCTEDKDGKALLTGLQSCRRSSAWHTPSIFFTYHAPAGDACDIELSGVDQYLSTDLPGGIDGVYKIDGCFEGLPKYKRTGKTPKGMDTILMLLHAAGSVQMPYLCDVVAENRLMWKARVFGDWDVSIGDERGDVTVVCIFNFSVHVPHRIDN
jgi:hypothetical protein